MNEWYVILVCVVLLFIFYKKQKKSTHKKRDEADCLKKYPSRSFEEVHGKLLCDGLSCSFNDPCQEAERLFCRNVLMKIFAPSEFSSQHIVCLPSGVCKIDFACLTKDNKKIAIELDGYVPHVSNLEREQFDKQLRRQNELVIAGWVLLRFSFDQCKNSPFYCINMIRKALGDSENNKTSMLEEVFTDIYFPQEERTDAVGILKAAGAQWTKLRKRWYLPEGLTENLALPTHWKLTTWTRCNKQGCGGEAYAKIGPYGAFWSCKKCNKTFKRVI